MAWIEKRKRWRLRDIYGGDRLTIISDLGIWKEAAGDALTEYRRAKTAGMAIEPKVTTMADIRDFLRARKEGRDDPDGFRPMPMEQVLDIYLHKHGPSLKGGVSDNTRSPYYDLKYRIGVMKRAWTGKMSDEMTKLDVRDFLAQFKTIGSRMRYLVVLSHLFSAIDDWNEDGVLKPPIKIPPRNPAKKWRKLMKPAEKRYNPNTRVLSPEEWARFRPHLPLRTQAICDIALRRFLRKADIKQISHLMIKQGTIQGLQEKTGEKFSVPVMDEQPTKYNFVNFRKDFDRAKVAAGMEYPKNHPLYFTFRDLRRTGATWAYRETKDLAGVSKMLGHRSLITTMHYLNISREDLRPLARAVDTLAKMRFTRIKK